MLTRKLTYSLAFALFVVSVSYADEPISAKFYKLDFVVKEMDGTKTLNSRGYSTVTKEQVGRACSIRTGSKVPYSPSPTSLQFYDLGVNIDCLDVKEVGGELSLSISADVISIPSDTPPNTPPLTRHNSWNATVLVPLAKPTLVFSSDDLTTKRVMQLQLTATPVGAGK